MECAMATFELDDNLVGLMLTSEIDPPEDEWERALGVLQRQIRNAKVEAEQLRLLSITQGGAPTTRQRAGLKVAFAGRHPKVSVVSAALDNPLKRGVATAIRWINPQVAFYDPLQIREALAHLDLSHGVDHVWDACRELELQIRPLPVVKDRREVLRR